jgi:outer membrane immunogenic protein
MRGYQAGLIAFLMLGGIAQAADDLPVVSADNVSPERFGWDGAYAGVTAGYGWLKDVDYAFTPPLRSEGEDWIFGGHAGYLYSWNNVVVGAEAEALNLDIQFAGLPVWASEAYTLKGRLGYAWDRLLFTGHLGGSYVITRSSIPIYNGLADWALTYGAGIDYAFTDNAIVGVSYSHMTSDRYDGTQIYADIDTLTLRLGYKF